MRKAMTVVRRMIELNLGSEDKYKGILVESCLEMDLIHEQTENRLTVVDRLGPKGCHQGA